MNKMCTQWPRRDWAGYQADSVGATQPLPWEELCVNVKSGSVLFNVKSGFHTVTQNTQRFNSKTA